MVPRLIMREDNKRLVLVNRGLVIGEKLVNTVKRLASSISNKAITLLSENTLSQWDYTECKKRKVWTDMLIRQLPLNTNTSLTFLKRLSRLLLKRGLSLLILGNTSLTNFFILILLRRHKLKQTANLTLNTLKTSEPKLSLKKIKS